MCHLVPGMCVPYYFVYNYIQYCHIHCVDAGAAVMVVCCNMIRATRCPRDTILPSTVTILFCCLIVFLLVSGRFTYVPTFDLFRMWYWYKVSCERCEFPTLFPPCGKVSSLILVLLFRYGATLSSYVMVHSSCSVDTDWWSIHRHSGDRCRSTKCIKVLFDPFGAQRSETATKKTVTLY